MGPGAHLVAGGALPAAAVRAQQRGGERARGHGPAAARRPGEQPGVGHPGIRLTAQNGARRVGGPAQFRDDRLLADQVAENPRARWACGRVLVAGDPGGDVGSHSTIAGKLPVSCSAAGGTGSGSRSRNRSWIWTLSSAGDWVASSTRYRSELARAWARNPSRTRSWNSAGSASSRSADTDRRLSPAAGGRSSRIVRSGSRPPVAHLFSPATSPTGC